MGVRLVGDGSWCRVFLSLTYCRRTVGYALSPSFSPLRIAAIVQALQYMQFHAETQLEMTQDQMERLRLSVSRAGPLQDALDNCYR